MTIYLTVYCAILHFTTAVIYLWLTQDATKGKKVNKGFSDDFLLKILWLFFNNNNIYDYSHDFREAS